jgi:hypothetical protein
MSLPAMRALSRLVAASFIQSTPVQKSKSDSGLFTNLKRLMIHEMARRFSNDLHFKGRLND